MRAMSELLFGRREANCKRIKLKSKRRMTYHVPVLLNESIQGLNIQAEGIYVDVTFGGGGHSREILNHLTNGRLFAFDQDDDAKANAIDDERFVLCEHNFRYMRNFLKFFGAEEVNGILADLGVSSHHFDAAERGFSFRFEAPLDMRMNQKAKLSAADVVNTYAERDLSTMFFRYGELKNARKLASIICKERSTKPISSIGEFKEMIQSCTPKHKENTYLAKVFQALRIEVNQEMKALEEFLKQSLEFLPSGGRLVVITYHSLEDRLVKNFMKSGNLEGKVEKDFYGNVLTPFKLINRKVIVPSEEELQINNRSRSAKLRIAEKI